MVLVVTVVAIGTYVEILESFRVKFQVVVLVWRLL